VDLTRTLRKRYAAVCTASKDHVIVVVLGFLFKVSLFYPKVFSLCRAVGNQARADVLERWYCMTPQHARYIKNLTDRHPAAALTMRIFKRFAASHFFEGYIPEEALELVVASVFTRGGTLSSIPASPFAAFLRALHRMSSHPWDKEPLQIDSSVPLPPATPRHPMHITAPYSYSSLFTQMTPDKGMLLRFVTLCRRAYASILPCPASLSWSTDIFRLHLSDYDVMVRLRPEVVSRRAEETMNVYAKGWTDRGPFVHQLATYEPRKEILRLLRTQMRERAMFFQGSDKNCILAVAMRSLDVGAVAEHMHEICGSAVSLIRVLNCPPPETGREETKKVVSKAKRRRTPEEGVKLKKRITS